MGEINLEESEKHAIAAIEVRELATLIDQSIATERWSGLRNLPLTQCSPYVGSKLHAFEQAVIAYANAKSSKKRQETRDVAEHAGRDLTFAVDRLKEALAEQTRDEARFRVDDQIMWPHRFSNHLSVSVRYSWRRTVDDDWAYGTITFDHEADPRRRFDVPTPSRKPSAAKVDAQFQERLSSIWQQLMRGALYSVREYLRAGGEGAAIPKAFEAIPDYQGGLNNHSTRFWGNKGLSPTPPAKRL